MCGGDVLERVERRQGSLPTTLSCRGFCAFRGCACPRILDRIVLCAISRSTFCGLLPLQPPFAMEIHGAVNVPLFAQGCPLFSRGIRPVVGEISRGAVFNIETRWSPVF